MYEHLQQVVAHGERLIDLMDAQEALVWAVATADRLVMFRTIDRINRAWAKLDRAEDCRYHGVPKAERWWLSTP